jgi:hypothetical protein
MSQIVLLVVTENVLVGKEGVGRDNAGERAGAVGCVCFDGFFDEGRVAESILLKV